MYVHINIIIYIFESGYHVLASLLFWEKLPGVSFGGNCDPRSKYWYVGALREEYHPAHAKKIVVARQANSKTSCNN